MSRTKNKLAAPTPLLDAAAPMPEPVARVVEVFKHDLEGLAFPDVSLASLEEAVETVRERANQVEALRNRIAIAEAELSTARSELESLAQRGLAYAKVYATGNADLTHQLEKINLAEPPKRKRRKAVKADQAAGTEPIDEQTEARDVEQAEVVDPGFSASPRNEESRSSHLSAVG